MISKELEEVLFKASERKPLTKEECRYILAFPETSYESGLVRNLSNKLVREKNDNSGIIIGQVGIDIHPCEAKCGFCAFGEGHTGVPTFKIKKHALKKQSTTFVEKGIFTVFI